MPELEVGGTASSCCGASPKPTSAPSSACCGSSTPAVPVKATACCSAPLPQVDVAAPVISCCGGATESLSAATTDQPERVEVSEAAADTGWKAYLPLLVIVTLSLLTSAALQVALPEGQRSAMLAMSQFMGIFLIFFAMLKLFDLPGFVKGFARYDLLAGAVPAYGFFYPFLELGFGLALLAQWRPFEVNAALAALMFFGSVGVLRSLGRGENLRCACMGSSLNVPLSTVAVIEDIGMGLMSLSMLAMLP